MSETQDHLAPPRRTLAMRLAERNGERELRAARLARLRAGEPARATAERPPRAEAVLEVYLPPAAGLSEALPESTLPPPAAEPAARPAAAPVALAVALAADPGELARLPGVGPGLAALLRRAGLSRLADLAPLEPAALAARLGPVGRLVPAARWIAVARAEAEAAPPEPPAVSIP